MKGQGPGRPPNQYKCIRITEDPPTFGVLDRTTGNVEKTRTQLDAHYRASELNGSLWRSRKPWNRGH